MKKTDVQINATYLVKVAGNLVPVRIDAEHENGGWLGTSRKTGKQIRIKSPQRLRKRLDDAVPVAKKAKKAKEATKDAKPAPERDTGERAATGGQREANDAKPMSLLDAAAHLLSLGTGNPMRCKDIVDLAIGRGLWTPGKGKTPANSLHAAIQRDIKTRGQASRFVKAERGKFAPASKA